nr:hypothetical protein [Tanacetum cinerariifolium]
MFTVNLHHDGVFIPNAIRYVEDFLNEEGNGNQLYESSYDYYSGDAVEEFDYVDFHIEGEENVIIKNLTTQYPFLNNLCSNHGTFGGFIDEHVDQEPIEDPNDANRDLIFKVKRGVFYPKHDSTNLWNEMQHVVGMRYEHLEQLKLALANYGVVNGYQLWYMRNDWRCMLVYCGRNIEVGWCAGLYNNNRNVVQRNCLMMVHQSQIRNPSQKKKPMPSKKGKPAKKATKPSDKVTPVKKGMPANRESVSNDPTHPTEPTSPIDVASSQDMYKGKDVQEGDDDVAASSKDKKK